MPRIGTDIKYKVSFVKHDSDKKGKPYTRFNVGDKIMNTSPPAYQNYSLSVDGILDIMDGDYVNILTISKVETKRSETNGKLYTNLYGTVQVLKSDTAQYVEEQPPAFIPPVDHGTNDPIDALEDGGSDPWKLPFDI